jgi:hypothetical protein
MATSDPAEAGEPRDVMDVALAAVSRRWNVGVTDALQLLLAWSVHHEMTVGDVADLVVVEAHVVAHRGR